MKHLIAGLGNIGEEYRDTRHNVGFMVLDAAAEASGISFMDRRYGFFCLNEAQERRADHAETINLHEPER